MLAAGIVGSLSGSSTVSGSATGAKPIWPCALLGGGSEATKPLGVSPLNDGSVSFGMRLNSLVWLDARTNRRQMQEGLSRGQSRLPPGVEGRLRMRLTRQIGLTLAGGNKS